MKCFKKHSPQDLLRMAIGICPGTRIKIKSGMLENLTGAVVGCESSNMVHVRVRVFGVDQDVHIDAERLSAENGHDENETVVFPTGDEKAIGRLIGLIIQENDAAMPWQDLHQALMECLPEFSQFRKECLTDVVLKEGAIERLSDGEVEVYAYVPWNLGVEEATARSIISILREQKPCGNGLRTCMSLSPIITRYTGQAAPDDKIMRNFKKKIMSKVLRLSPQIKEVGYGYRAID